MLSSTSRHDQAFARDCSREHMFVDELLRKFGRSKTFYNRPRQTECG
jgi:hypothetical protein